MSHRNRHVAVELKKEMDRQNGFKPKSNILAFNFNKYFQFHLFSFDRTFSSSFSLKRSFCELIFWESTIHSIATTERKNTTTITKNAMPTLFLPASFREKVLIATGILDLISVCVVRTKWLGWYKCISACG